MPDSRIQADFPRVSIEPAPVKSSPLFGRVKEIRWGPSEGYFNKVRGFSHRVADILNGDAPVMRSVLSSGLDYFRVSVEPSNGCWIMGNQVGDAAEITLSKPRWNCYQAITKALLAIPIPDDK